LHFACNFGTYEGWVSQKSSQTKPSGGVQRARKQANLFSTIQLPTGSLVMTGVIEADTLPATARTFSLELAGTGYQCAERMI
jgi:hypothetical protein